MNAADASKQIDQMIAFILQEAREKAEEIKVKTEKEFMADKLSLETQQNQVIRQEHEKQKKLALVQKKIEKSKKLTEVRFNTMRKRDEKINELKKAVTEKLADISSRKEYKDLVRYLIAQGLMTMMEHNITLRCRQQDVKIVQAELPAAIKLFQTTMSEATGGVTPSVNVTIDQKEFLPPGPVKGQVGPSSTGGIELIANGGQIICRNTLDHRLDIAFDALKPAVRGILFGVRPKPVFKEAEKKSHH
jgi:V-type H+-transporting ATPase subunit E